MGNSVRLRVDLFCIHLKKITQKGNFTGQKSREIKNHRSLNFTGTFLLSIKIAAGRLFVGFLI